MPKHKTLAANGSSIDEPIQLTQKSYTLPDLADLARVETNRLSQIWRFTDNDMADGARVYVTNDRLVEALARYDIRAEVAISYAVTVSEEDLEEINAGASAISYGDGQVEDLEDLPADVGPGPSGGDSEPAGDGQAVPAEDLEAAPQTTAAEAEPTSVEFYATDTEQAEAEVEITTSGGHGYSHRMVYGAPALTESFVPAPDAQPIDAEDLGEAELAIEMLAARCEEPAPLPERPEEAAGRVLTAMLLNSAETLAEIARAARLDEDEVRTILEERRRRGLVRVDDSDEREDRYFLARPAAVEAAEAPDPEVEHVRRLTDRVAAEPASPRIRMLTIEDPTEQLAEAVGRYNGAMATRDPAKIERARKDYLSQLGRCRHAVAVALTRSAEMQRTVNLAERMAQAGEEAATGRPRRRKRWLKQLFG